MSTYNSKSFCPIKTGKLKLKKPFIVPFTSEIPPPLCGPLTLPPPPFPNPARPLPNIHSQRQNPPPPYPPTLLYQLNLDTVNDDISSRMNPANKLRAPSPLSDEQTELLPVWDNRMSKPKEYHLVLLAKHYPLDTTIIFNIEGLINTPFHKYVINFNLDGMVKMV